MKKLSEFLTLSFRDKPNLHTKQQRKYLAQNLLLRMSYQSPTHAAKKAALQQMCLSSIRLRRTRLTPAAVAVAACFSLSVQAAPNDPTIVSGQVSFGQAGNALTITN